MSTIFVKGDRYCGTVGVSAGAQPLKYLACSVRSPRLDMVTKLRKVAFHDIWCRGGDDSSVDDIPYSCGTEVISRRPWGSFPPKLMHCDESSIRRQLCRNILLLRIRICDHYDQDQVLCGETEAIMILSLTSEKPLNSYCTVQISTQLSQQVVCRRDNTGCAHMHFIFIDLHSGSLLQEQCAISHISVRHVDADRKHLRSISRCPSMVGRSDHICLLSSHLGREVWQDQLPHEVRVPSLGYLLV
jgi:hypothetical protein